MEVGKHEEVNEEEEEEGKDEGRGGEAAGWEGGWMKWKSKKRNVAEEQVSLSSDKM